MTFFKNFIKYFAISVIAVIIVAVVLQVFGKKEEPKPEPQENQNQTEVTEPQEEQTHQDVTEPQQNNADINNNITEPQQNQSNLNLSNVTELEIETYSAFILLTNSDKLTVDVHNDEIEVYEKDGKLIIKEPKKDFGITSNKDYNDIKNADITIAMPYETNFKKAKITAGAGKISGGFLYCDELYADMGAGYFGFADMIVKDKAIINGGEAEISIGCGTINDLELNMGIGKLLLLSKLTGKSDINLGVGKAVISLYGDLEIYELNVSKGLGKLTVDDKDVSGDYRVGNGQSKVNVDGGVGNIDITLFNNGYNS